MYIIYSALIITIRVWPNKGKNLLSFFLIWIRLAEVLSCKVEQLPTTYLGLTLAAKKRIWQGVIDKCISKLTPWKRQYLSLDGRLTLVSSLLDGVPTYMMFLFKLDVNLEKHWTTIRSNFVWEGNADKRKLHKVKWQKVTITRKEVEWGVRNLSLHNKSLLYKRLWKYMMVRKILGRRW